MPRLFLLPIAALILHVQPPYPQQRVGTTSKGGQRWPSHCPALPQTPGLWLSWLLCLLWAPSPSSAIGLEKVLVLEFTLDGI